MVFLCPQSLPECPCPLRLAFHCFQWTSFWCANHASSSFSAPADDTKFSLLEYCPTLWEVCQFFLFFAAYLKGGTGSWMDSFCCCQAITKRGCSTVSKAATECPAVLWLIFFLFIHFVAVRHCMIYRTPMKLVWRVHFCLFADFRGNMGL